MGNAAHSEIAEQLSAIAQKEQTRLQTIQHRVVVCMGTACVSSHSDQLKTTLENEVKTHHLERQCQVISGGCRGLCASGPMVSVDTGHETEEILYQQVTTDDAPKIVEAVGGEPVKELAVSLDIPFFQRQKRIVLESFGKLDPDSLENYITAGGYTALEKALSSMTPAEVIEEITRSGLRGRGGAGYPVGLKWSTVSKASSDHKYVICNGDEGDPGAFMDRSVMEAYPFRVLEGMTLAAYAIGADRGYCYVRAEYPLAVQRLRSAIKQLEKQKLLGTDIGGTPFNFTVEVRLGAGAFVCGEETALMASIEGKRGQPRPRPPYPAQSGLWGYPTLINNVETFANIAQIVANGASWYNAIGTEKSKGTKVFALSGSVVHTGLIEVPMGMTLREIVFDIGGGIPDGKRFKAVQTGGPAGGCIPESYLDTPVDYESLLKLGSFMGSGGMIVMDESSCMVDVAKYFMEFCMSESCGKCVPCRVGTAQMYDLLAKITQGEATLDDLALLERLCDMVKSTSLCGLGQGAPNPIISTLRYFRDEYLAHIVEKRCPAGVCKLHGTNHATSEPSNTHQEVYV